MSRTQEVPAATQKKQEAQQQASDGGALVTVDASGDGWSDAAAEADARWIQGTLVLFADWQWTQGSEKTLMEKGRKLVAVGVRSTWVFWENGKPVDYRPALPGRHLLPSRESLGYLNEAEWEIDARGDAKDPWANTRYVYLLDPETAEMLTFSTHTVGGRRCVEDLASAIKRMRFEHPGATPVVELEAAPMPTQHGRKSRPVLKIVGWKFPTAKVIDAAPPSPVLAPSATVAPSDMNDEIPF
jgi:hypothetical protein